MNCGSIPRKLVGEIIISAELSQGILKETPRKSWEEIQLRQKSWEKFLHESRDFAELPRKPCGKKIDRNSCKNVATISRKFRHKNY